MEQRFRGLRGTIRVGGVMAYQEFGGKNGTTGRAHPYIPDLQAIKAEPEKAERKKKKLERIVQKAEAAQRLAKLGSWK